MPRSLLLPIGLAGSLLATSALALEADPAPKPIEIGERMCLFLDDRFVAEQSGLTRTWHQGRPRPEPAIAVTEPWEKWPHLFGSVLYDPHSKLYKMWYEDIPDRGAILYAESRDGKTWTRPRLNLISLKGLKENNCVLYPVELPNVFLDPNETDPTARFKMFAWGGPFGDKKLSGHVLFASEDGIRWRVVEGNSMPRATDDTAKARTVCDTNQVIWDPLGQRYLGAYRTFPLHPGLTGWTRDDKHRTLPKVGGHRRGVGIATSKKLTSGWSNIVTALQADDRDDAKARRLSRTDAVDFAELYAMPVFVYGNHYLGIVSLLFQVDAAPETMNDGVPHDRRADTQRGGGDLQLTFSHDGQSWKRQPDRQTLIAPGPTKLVPCYAACNEPLFLGDEMWIYYTEADSAHPAPDHKSAIRAAVWRKDGFVSLDAADRATLLTHPLAWQGKRLVLNTKVARHGTMRVALLTEAGKPLPGFDLKDCDGIAGDRVETNVTWAGKSDLSALQGTVVRLRMEMTHCNLYGFRASRQ